MEFGLYEQIINKVLSNIDEELIQVEKNKIDKEKAPQILSKYFSSVLERGLKDLKDSNCSVEEQLEF